MTDAIAVSTSQRYWEGAQPRSNNAAYSINGSNSIHHVVEIPADDPVGFSLPILAKLSGGSSDVDGNVSVRTSQQKRRGEKRQDLRAG